MLTDKLNAAHAVLTQSQAAGQARAVLQNFRFVVLDTNRDIQNIVDAGNFDTLDNEIKAALVAAWNVSKASQTALEEASIAELLDWTP